MSLKYDTSRTAAIEELRRLNLLTLNIAYARVNQGVIKSLYEKGIIDDSSIEEALETPVFNLARRYYQMMTKKGKIHITTADQLARPECFAYALDKGMFTRREMRQIPFDDGDTVRTFTGRYNLEKLLPALRVELLNPKPLPNFNEGSGCNCRL